MQNSSKAKNKTIYRKALKRTDYTFWILTEYDGNTPSSLLKYSSHTASPFTELMLILCGTVVTAISGLVAEVQQQMEASYAQNQQRQVNACSNPTWYRHLLQ